MKTLDQAVEILLTYQSISEGIPKDVFEYLNNRNHEKVWQSNHLLPHLHSVLESAISKNDLPMVFLFSRYKAELITNLFRVDHDFIFETLTHFPNEKINRILLDNSGGFCLSVFREELLYRTILFSSNHSNIGRLPEYISLLCQHGAVIGKNNGSKNVLMLAAMLGHKSVIDALVQHGANLYACDEDNKNFMDIAIMNRQDEVVCGYIDSVTFMYPLIALMRAIEQSNVSLVQSILGKYTIDMSDSCDSLTPLMLAVRSAYTSKEDSQKTLDYLLEHSAVDINASCRQSTPLHVAAFNGKSDLMIKLIENGANLFAVDTNGKTPLYLFIERFNYCAPIQKVVRSLLSKYGKITFEDLDEMTQNLITNVDQGLAEGKQIRLALQDNTEQVKDSIRLGSLFDEKSHDARKLQADETPTRPSEIEERPQLPNIIDFFQ